MDIVLDLAAYAVWLAIGLGLGYTRWHRPTPNIVIKSGGGELTQAELDQIAAAVRSELAATQRREH